MAMEKGSQPPSQFPSDFHGFGDEAYGPLSAVQAAMRTAEIHQATSERLGRENDALRNQVAQLQNQVDHDPDTDLLRKNVWRTRLQERLDLNKATAVFFLDFNFFKLVNDTFGHEEADRVLAAFGAHMNARFVRGTDAISHERKYDSSASGGRLGGDEFGFVSDLSGNEKRGNGHNGNLHSRADAELAYIQEVLADFVSQQPRHIQGLGFNIAVGIAIYDPNHPVDISTLLAQADEAMREDKDEQGSDRR